MSAGEIDSVNMTSESAYAKQTDMGIGHSSGPDQGFAEAVLDFVPFVGMQQRGWLSSDLF